jgi:hypothetical protein
VPNAERGPIYIYIYIGCVCASACQGTFLAEQRIAEVGVLAPFSVRTETDCLWQSSKSSRNPKTSAENTFVCVSSIYA